MQVEQQEPKNEIIGMSTQATSATQHMQAEQQLRPKKKKVIIALPGDNFSSKFLVSWSNALAALWMSDKYEVAVAPGTGSYVTFVRMHTLGLDVKRGVTQKPFNGDDFDIWVTIDSDVIFNPDQLTELLDATEKHPVVAGVYRMADLEHFAVVKNWDTNYFAKNGTFEFLKQDDLTKWKTETGLKYMPINYTGMGFFACRKEVLDKLTYPYFNGELREIVSDNGIIMKDISSEDVNFCQNISKAGFEIVINVDMRVGHLKPLVI
jgi:hypothetical protein